jgi:hypothetical protein
MTAESFDPVGEAILRSNVEYLLQERAYDDLNRLTAITLAGQIKDTDSPFDSSTKKTTELYQFSNVTAEGIVKNSLFLFKRHFPTSVEATRFTLTPLRLINFDDGSSVEKEHVTFIRHLFDMTDWDEEMSAQAATLENISRTVTI